MPDKNAHNCSTASQPKATIYYADVSIWQTPEVLLKQIQNYRHFIRPSEKYKTIFIFLV